MAQATVTIVKTNREKLIVRSVFLTRDKAEALKIIDAALAVRGVTTEGIIVAEYTIDGQMIVAYLRRADGLHVLNSQPK